MHFVVAFPLDKVLGATIADAGVQDLFDFVVFLAIYEDQVQWRKLSSTREQICWHREELHDWEDRMELSERGQEFDSVCACSDCFQNPEGSEAKQCELLVRSIDPDVGGINENHVPWLEFGGQVRDIGCSTRRTQPWPSRVMPLLH